MNNKSFQIVVIGGGPAGVIAALRARELGASVALVERHSLGGTCTNDGCVPTRVLAKAARLRRDSEQYQDYGLSAYTPEVDFPRLLERTNHLVYKIHEKKQLLHSLNEAGVQVFEEVGQAAFIDPHTIEAKDGLQLQGDKFILCVGGHAFRPNFPGAELTLTHSQIWSLRHLPASMIIIGGAATGCQLASIFSAFGTKVWILEKGTTLLRREDEIIGLAVSESFERRGIEVITGIDGIDGIKRSSSTHQVNYSKEGQAELLEAEAVVLAIGWPGNIDPLNLSVVGVVAERGYIRVDDHYCTNIEHIFAAGDITGRMMLVQSAGYEARVAAENAVLGLGQRHKHQVVPHGGFTDPEYGSVGLTEEEALASSQSYLSAVVPFSDLDRAVIDGRTDGCCKLIISTETHRIMGAHVVGEQALEIVHLVAAAMEGNMMVEQIAELEIAYPTNTAVVGLAARKLVREMGVLPLTKEWRSLGRHFSEWEKRV